MMPPWRLTVAGSGHHPARAPLRSSARTGPRGDMRKLIAAFMASVILTVGGVACDDNTASDKIDEDDTNFGPGDGKDEIGPAR